MTRFFIFPGSDADGEPARDASLGALLRQVVGEPPMADVDWSALADRVSGAVRAQHAAPWWAHVERWQRRALPLALAAGIVGALAFWNASASARLDTFAVATGDPVNAVVSGASSDDAATSYAGSVTSSADLVSGVPE
jgi:hypothetical protein